MRSQPVTREDLELARDIAIYGLIARALMSRGAEVSVSTKKLIKAYMQFFADDEDELGRVKQAAERPVMLGLIKYYLNIIANYSGFLSRTWDVSGGTLYLFDARKLRDALNEDPQRLVEYLNEVVADA